MKPWILITSGLLVGGAATGAVILATHSAQTPGDSGSGAEVTALRSQLEDLRKDQAAMKSRLESLQSATAVSEAREKVAPPVAAKPNAAQSPTANVSSLDRDTVFALIKEERDLRDKEQKEKQRQQVKDNLSQRIKREAERMGLDSATTDSLTRLYLENLAREEEIRKAYPFGGMEDPNAEKRRLELEATRKTLDASIASIIPSDKREDWDRRTRAIRRAGDFAAMADMGSDGQLMRAFGMGDFGPGGGGMAGFGGQGGNNNNGGGRNNRRGNDGNNNGGNNSAGQAKSAEAAASGAAPAPPKKDGE